MSRIRSRRLHSDVSCTDTARGPKSEGADGWNASIDMVEEKLQVIKSRGRT